MISNPVSTLVVLAFVFTFQISALPVADIPETSNELRNDSIPIRPRFRLHNNNYAPPTFTILTSENMPSTWPYYDDLNEIAGHCYTGTWITYGFTNYTASEFSVGGLIYSNETEGCKGKQWPTFSSFRFAGSPTDIHASTLSTYENAGYTGNATMFAGDTPSLTLQYFGALIVTGGSPVTLYSRENYQGFKLCLNAPQNGVGAGIREVARTLGLLPEDVKSIRFSCDDNTSRVDLERNSG